MAPSKGGRLPWSGEILYGSDMGVDRSPNGAERLGQLAMDSVLSNSNVVVVVLDPEMNVCWVSPSAVTYGVDPVGTSIVELVHADDLDRVATTFDMSGGPDRYQVSRLTNVVIPVRIVTPARVVPFEATGRWINDDADSWWFVVALIDVTTRVALTDALRTMAVDADEDNSIGALLDACRAVDGIDGAQITWWNSDGALASHGDLDGGHHGVAHIDQVGELNANGRAIAVDGADWAWVFPVLGTDETLGVFAFWGIGPTPEFGWLRVAVAPILDLAGLGLTRSRAQSALAERAVTDPVTGLLNRRGFFDQFPVKHNEWVAVMYVDLDGFKEVNDTWGHTVGDHVLRLVGDRMRNVLSRGDTIARIGGDEFAVLCRWVRPDAAEAIAERVVEALNRDYDVEGLTVPGGASVGVVVGSRKSTGPELLDAADRALLSAKAQGKARMAVAGQPSNVGD